MYSIVSIYTMKELQSLPQYVDMPLLMVEGISLNHKDLNIDYALAYLRATNQKCIVAMDKMYTPKEMPYAKKFLNQYKEIINGFYVTDIGIMQYCTEIGIKDKVIFDPKTMITNRLDLEIFSEYARVCGISSEITIFDQLALMKDMENRVFLQVFGYRMMFYSKRQLISLYGNKNGVEYPKEDVLFRESTRKDFFPGFENENGTVMYRSYCISLIEYIGQFKDAYCFFESYRIPLPTMIEVLKTFKAVEKKDISIETGKRILDGLDIPIEDGFMYKDSVYQKEELKNE